MRTQPFIHGWMLHSILTGRRSATRPLISKAQKSRVAGFVERAAKEKHISIATGGKSPGGKGFEASGLNLQDHAGVMKGTKFGPMVIAGDPGASSLMALLDWRVAPQIRMPHGTKKLSTCDRDAIRSWIYEGALDN